MREGWERREKEEDRKMYRLCESVYYPTCYVMTCLKGLATAKVKVVTLYVVTEMQVSLI